MVFTLQHLQLKQLSIALLLVIAGCSGTPSNTIESIGDTSIQGDFDGDGQTETAVVWQTQEAVGNPLGDGIPAAFVIRFWESDLQDIDINCCEGQLILEGDLDGNGSDEFSVFQDPMNGCAITLKTYRYINQQFEQLQSVLIPNGCEPLTLKEMQDRVYLEGGKVFVLKVDPNDEGMKLMPEALPLD